MYCFDRIVPWWRVYASVNWVSELGHDWFMYCPANWTNWTLREKVNDIWIKSTKTFIEEENVFFKGRLQNAVYFV